jgi:hypothetical protein
MTNDNDYQEYLKELESFRQEAIKDNCSKGSHTFGHYYDFKRCSTCGYMEDIPTSKEYLEQCHTTAIV